MSAGYAGRSTDVPRVLVVEDDDALRDALAIAIRDEGSEVLGKADGTEIPDALTTFDPDVVILDVRLPGGVTGIDVARQIRTRSDVPIVFLTAADGVRDRLEGFEVGGDDYVTKPFAMPELLARIQALLRRSGRATSKRRVIHDIVIDEEGHIVERAGQRVNLTRTEYDLLVTLARRPGQVFSKTRLLALIWDYEHYDPNVVEVHVSALRRKLEAHGPRLIQTVRGVGYVLRPS